jgi:hypothetical protein
MPQRLPRLPDIANRLPRLESLLSPDTAPLATSMADAPMPLRCLDAFQPTRFKFLHSRERQPNGAWRLEPGLNEITLHSFCGMFATYAPHKALGYLPAPYKGRIASIFQKLMQRYADRADLEQGDVQMLVWGLLARVKPSALRGPARAAAEKLLTTDELRELEGFGVDALRDEVVRRLLPQVRDALRPLLEIENRVRQLLAEGVRHYQELEQVVMRPFDPKDKILVEPRHWYWYPKGRYFLQFDPNGFSRTQIRIWVPRPIEARYDAHGRIESLALAGQWRISVQYDDTVEPWRCPREPRWLAYRFTTIRFERLDLGQEHLAEVNGWLFATEKRASSAGGVRIASRTAVSPFQREPSWIGRWIDRVDEANQTRREIESYREWAERTGRIWRGQPSSDSFFDREHYVHGVRDAIRGTSAERVEWIAETHANSAEALAHAINVLDTLPTESHAEYEPSGYLATPGSRGGQRLLISGHVDR